MDCGGKRAIAVDAFLYLHEGIWFFLRPLCLRQLLYLCRGNRVQKREWQKKCSGAHREQLEKMYYFVNPWDTIVNISLPINFYVWKFLEILRAIQLYLDICYRNLKVRSWIFRDSSNHFRRVKKWTRVIILITISKRDFFYMAYKQK